MLTQEMESPEQIAARQDEKLNGVFSSRLPQTAELDLTQRNSFRQSQKFAQQVRYHLIENRLSKILSRLQFMDQSLDAVVMRQHFVFFAKDNDAA